MAYPFAPMPSLGEFIDRVIAEYGVEIKEPEGPLIGPRGQAKAVYLFRKMDGENPRFAIIPDLRNDEMLVPDTLRSLCRQLGVPLEDFGLTLG